MNDPDEIIEELESLRNNFDKDIVFSKNGIIQYIKNFLDFENSPEELKKWEVKTNTSEMNLALKKNGSEFSKE